MKAKQILSDPCASYWLKRAIVDSQARDIVDALNDAETLVRVLESELDTILGKHIQ
jgi:hypothetical protein